METKKNTTLASGAELVLHLADFKNSTALNRALMNAASKANMDIDIGDIKSNGMSALADLAPMFMTIAGSEEVEDAIIGCLNRSTWNNSRISVELFDDNPNARGDFYEIAIECVKFNSQVFMKALLSKLSTPKKTATEKSQK